MHFKDKRENPGLPREFMRPWANYKCGALVQNCMI